MSREWLDNDSIMTRDWHENVKDMEVKLKPEFWMFSELHGRVGNWIYRTRKKENGEIKVFAHYRPKKGSNPNPEYGKLF